MAGRVLTCPWHKWQFDLTTGRTVSDFDRRRLISYPVLRRDGMVYLSIPSSQLERRTGKARETL
jgi:nitrite reductase/ring-hydroxylating ferredoxin subunit